MTLAARVPAEPDPDALFDAFSAWTGEQGLELYPAQDEALIELVSGSNVVLATPTGSGKSLVAVGALFAALAQRRARVLHGADQGARVGEVLRAVRHLRRRERRHGHRRRGGQPGRADHRCTAEILANIALREGADADLGLVVMDEFHYYADPDRGWAWQVPLLELPRAQFLLMSATLGDVSRFADDLDPAHRPADRRSSTGGAAGAAALLLRTHAGARDARGAARHRAGAGLRRALSPRPPRWSGRRR